MTAPRLIQIKKSARGRIQVLAAMEVLPPHCAACDRPMAMIRATPKVGPHPGLLTFRCATCGEVKTLEVPCEPPATPQS